MPKMKHITKDLSKWEIGGFPMLSVGWTLYELGGLQELGVPPEHVPRILFILAFVLMLVRMGQQKWHAKNNNGDQ